MGFQWLEVANKFMQEKMRARENEVSWSGIQHVKNDWKYETMTWVARDISFNKSLNCPGQEKMRANKKKYIGPRK